MYRTSRRNDTNKIYPMTLFERISNAKERPRTDSIYYDDESEFKCDLATFKASIRKHVETLLNSRSYAYWRDLHPKIKPPESLVKGDDPNSPHKNKEIDDDIIIMPEDNEYKRPRCTMFEYGLSDYTLCDLSVGSERQELADEIKFKIEAFERRLKNIKVEVVMGDKNSKDRRIQIKIEAALNVYEDELEEIEFDTCLMPVKRVFSVDEA